MSEPNLPAVADNAAGASLLFATDDPRIVVRRAEEIATVLTEVLEARNLVLHIGNPPGHVLIEGLTLLAAMTGIATEIEWSRELPNGWEAKATARNAAGRIVGQAEAQCTRLERHWRDRDDYALRSMSQTRAIAKALRIPLGWIVVLAGFDATPAEELPPDDAGPSRGPGNRSDPAPPPGRSGTSDALRGEINAAAELRGIGPDELLEIARGVRGGRPGQARADELRKILAQVEERPIPEADSEDGLPA